MYQILTSLPHRADRLPTCKTCSALADCVDALWIYRASFLSSGGVERGWAGFPRKLFSPGSTGVRCVCVEDPIAADEDANIQKYGGCPQDANSCSVWGLAQKVDLHFIYLCSLFHGQKTHKTIWFFSPLNEENTCDAHNGITYLHGDDTKLKRNLWKNRIFWRNSSGTFTEKHYH